MGSETLIVHTRALTPIAKWLVDVLSERQVRSRRWQLTSTVASATIGKVVDDSQLTVLLVSSHMLASPSISHLLDTHVSQKQPVIAAMFDENRRIHAIAPLTSLLSQPGHVGNFDVSIKRSAQIVYEVLSLLFDPALVAHITDDSHPMVSEHRGPLVDTSGIVIYASSPERVAFTQLHRMVVRAGESSPIVVYVHMARAIDRVLSDFGASVHNAHDYAHGTESSALPFREGTRFTLIPFFEHAKVTPASADVVWDEDLVRVTFEVTPKPEAGRIGFVSGNIQVMVGPLIVATMDLTLSVVDQPHREIGRSAATAAQHSPLFLSYSHKDDDIVRIIEQMYARYPEIETFVDRRFLTTGDDWWEVVQAKITEAKALQLFWSPRSSISSNVEKEWRFALELPRKILPVIIGQPRPKIPIELRHLHFQPIAEFAGDLL